MIQVATLQSDGHRARPAPTISVQTTPQLGQDCPL